MRKILVLFSMILFLLPTACSVPTINKQPGTVGEGTNTAASTGNRTTWGETTGNTQGSSQGSTAQPPAGQTNVTLYYQDAAGELIPVTRGIPRQEGIAAATMRGLIDNSATREELGYYGLYPVLPQGTLVQGITIREGTAAIDFNKKVLEYKNKKEEQAIVASVVYTLTEFSTIDRVRIMVNGYAQGKLKFGTDISGDLSRENVFINADKIRAAANEKKLDIYLVKEVIDNGGYYIPVSVAFTGDKEKMPSNIINALGKDYEDRKLYSQMPDGVQLLESGISGDTITLDFNGAIKNYGGNSREEALINQILYSMKQIEGVKKVKLLIEGNDGYLPEGTELKDAFTIPVKINEIFKKG